MSHKVKRIKCKGKKVEQIKKYIKIVKSAEGGRNNITMEDFYFIHEK